MASTKKAKSKKKVSSKPKPKAKAKSSKKKPASKHTSIRDIVARSAPPPEFQAPDEPPPTHDSVDISGSKDNESKTSARKLEEEESEEKLRALAVIEGMIDKFQSKLHDASLQLKEAIAIAFAAEARCLRDKSIRDLHLKQRLQVKEMALLAASLDGQIKKHVKRSSYIIPTRMADIRNDIRKDAGHPDRDNDRNSVWGDIRNYVRNSAR